MSSQILIENVEKKLQSYSWKTLGSLVLLISIIAIKLLKLNPTIPNVNSCTYMEERSKLWVKPE